MEYVPGVKAGGNGAVEGIFPNEVEGAAAQGVDLVVDKNIAGAGEGEQELAVVVEMETAHAPRVVVIELQVEINLGHTPAPP